MVPRKGKFWKVAAMCFGIAAVAFVALLLAARSPYGFLNDFKAAPRESAWVAGSHSAGKLKCFSFEAPFEEVLRAAKRDLSREGWTLDYEDPKLSIFLRKRGGRTEEATLTAVDTSRSGDEEPETTTCLVWLPYEPNWIQRKMDEVRDRFGWRQKMTPTVVNGYVAGLSYVYVPKRVWKGLSVDLIWRNLDTAQQTVTLHMFDVENYEPDEALPTKVVVPARKCYIQHLTYPNEAWNERDLGVSVKYSHSGARESVTSMYLEHIPEPSIGSGTSAGRPFIEITNAVDTRLARVFEIRSLKLVAGGSPVTSLPHLQRLAPHQSLTIPLDFKPTLAPLLKFEYRLLPNKRWRVMQFEGEGADF